MPKPQAQPGGRGETPGGQQQVPEKPEMVEALGPRDRVDAALGEKPVSGRDDREQSRQKGQADAFEANENRSRQSPATPLHRREVSAQDEKQRHEKPRQGAEQVRVGVVERFRLLGVRMFRRPEVGKRHQETQRVHQDNEQHGNGAQRVQVVQPPRPCRDPAFSAQSRHHSAFETYVQ